MESLFSLLPVASSEYRPPLNETSEDFIRDLRRVVLFGTSPATTHCLFPCFVFFSWPNNRTGLADLSISFRTPGVASPREDAGFFAPSNTHCLFPCLVVISRPSNARGFSCRAGLARLPGFGEIKITSVSFCGGIQTLFLEGLVVLVGGVLGGFG